MPTEPVSSSPITAPLTAADIASRVAPSVVEVLTQDGHGSGVGIAAGVITNADVVDGASAIQVATQDGRVAPAIVLRFDRTADLALLQANLTIPPLDLESMGQQRQGDEVLVLGYPLDLRVGAGGQATLTRGLISGTGLEQGTGRALIQTDAAINPGNSGGAMVNMRGKLVGLPTFSMTNAQNVNFAIATESIQIFLRKQSVASGTPRPTEIPTHPAAVTTVPTAAPSVTSARATEHLRGTVYAAGTALELRAVARWPIDGV